MFYNTHVKVYVNAALKENPNNNLRVALQNRITAERWEVDKATLGAEVTARQEEDYAEKLAKWQKDRDPQNVLDLSDVYVHLLWK